MITIPPLVYSSASPSSQAASQEARARLIKIAMTVAIVSVALFVIIATVSSSPSLIGIVLLATLPLATVFLANVWAPRRHPTYSPSYSVVDLPPQYIMQPPLSRGRTNSANAYVYRATRYAGPLYPSSVLASPVRTEPERLVFRGNTRRNSADASPANAVSRRAALGGTPLGNGSSGHVDSPAQQRLFGLRGAATQPVK